MALLGLFSILQIVFLPGYLLVRCLRLGGGVLATLVLAFALSLVANYVLVTGLVVLGTYRPVIVYTVFAAEIATVLWIERRDVPASSIDAWRFRIGDFFGAGPRSPLRRVLLAAAIIVIAGFALSGMTQIGQIFQQWDAVVSWNRWAIDWAAGHLPDRTGLYPQLLPANVSLTYVFIQTSEVWIFAKAFQFLFCLMLLLAMLDAARVTGRFGFVPGVLATYGLLVAVLRFRMIGSGYADMPLAFLAFAAVYTLLLAGQAEEAQMRRRYVLVGAALAAGAAITKQTGLYVAALYPLLAWRFVLRSGQQSDLRNWREKKRIRHTPCADDRRHIDHEYVVPGAEYAGLWRHAGILLRVAVLMAVLVAPWYLYKLAAFHATVDYDNTARLVCELHEGRNLPQRMLHAADMVVEAITPAGAVLLLAAIGLGLRDPLQSWLVGLVVVPLLLVWAAAFSYDLRNLALVLPFAGAAAGAGLLHAVERIGRRSLPAAAMPTGVQDAAEPVAAGVPADGCLRRLWIGRVAASLTLAIVAACLCVSEETLRQWQAPQQRLVGIPELNQRLYLYFESRGGPAMIAADYQALPWLPELGPRSVRCSGEALDDFRAVYDRPEVHFALVEKQAAAREVLEYLDGPGGRLIFDAWGYRLHEKQSGGTRFTRPTLRADN